MRTCSCEPCSCLEPCLETVPGTLLRNRFWEPYLQAVPKNLTLLGKLFLDTCLEASSWKLAWERFSPTAYVSLGSAATPRTRFPIKFSRNRLQARLPGTIPKNRFPGKVPKQGFQIQLPSKVPRNMFLSKVPKQGSQEQVSKKRLQKRFQRIGSQARGFQARFLGTGSQARFPRTAPQARFASKLRKNRFPSKGSFKEQVPKNWFGFQEQIL